MTREAELLHRYCVYGLRVASDRPLLLPPDASDGFCDLEIVHGDERTLAAALAGGIVESESDGWFSRSVLDDGSHHVRWDTVGEFVVSADGRRMLCRRLDSAEPASFHVYMLGQALSYALVQQGLEPLHATAVVLDGEAVAFLGGNAFGKSTLAACFLARGGRMLTDDLLIVRESDGIVRAYPGPARLKLFPGIARRLLGNVGGAPRMNVDTRKLILPLDSTGVCATPAPLRAIYSVAPPRDAARRPHVAVERVSRRRAFVELLRGTLNRRSRGPARRTRQFSTLARIVETVPIRTLSFPRSLERLTEVCDAVLDDLAEGRSVPTPSDFALSVN